LNTIARELVVPWSRAMMCCIWSWLRSDKEGLRGIEEWAFYTEPFGPPATAGTRRTVTVGDNLIRGRLSALGSGHATLASTQAFVPTTEARRFE